jgi:hypothetical protein
MEYWNDDMLIKIQENILQHSIFPLFQKRTVYNPMVNMEMQNILF